MAETKVTINGETDGGGVWQSWTPTITNSGGSITATAGFAKYTRIGKTIHFKAAINISAVGAVGGLRFTPPVAAAAEQSYVGSGREDAATGKMVEVMFKSTISYISLFFYDNTGSTATAGYSHIINGTYEAA